MKNLGAVRVNFWFAGRIQIARKRDMSYTSQKQLTSFPEF